MHTDESHKRNGLRRSRCVVALGFLMLALKPGPQIHAQDRTKDISEKLQGFDGYMEQLLKDWNAPGVGVGIVVDDQLVFAKGYGYRDYEKKLPVHTPRPYVPLLPTLNCSRPSLPGCCGGRRQAHVG